MIKNKVKKIMFLSIMALSNLVFAVNENNIKNIDMSIFGNDKSINIQPLQMYEKIKNSAGEVNISKEYNSISQDYREKYIILHYTAVGREGSIRALTGRNVSSHYLVSDRIEDPIYSLVPTERRAWHAGASAWKTRNNLNDTSIGIEIVNLGSVNGVYEPYLPFQMENVAVLVKYLVDKYDVPAENILGHSDIAPGRKSDPGPMFDWKMLYEKYNLGMWYDETAVENYKTMYAETFETIPVSDIQAELKKFGYGIDITGAWDKQSKSVITAFQHHFRPSNYDGVMDIETYSILKSLNDKYNKK